MSSIIKHIGARVPHHVLAQWYPITYSKGIPLHIGKLLVGYRTQTQHTPDLPDELLRS